VVILINGSIEFRMGDVGAARGLARADGLEPQPIGPPVRRNGTPGPATGVVGLAFARMHVAENLLAAGFGQLPPLGLDALAFSAGV
jgi:hypothetical protein